MAKGKRRKEVEKKKKARKEAAMKHPSGESQYGRKKRYCESNGVWGFQVPEPKPWR
jgi:hypothetical protein